MRLILEILRYILWDTLCIDCVTTRGNAMYFVNLGKETRRLSRDKSLGNEARHIKVHRSPTLIHDSQCNTENTILNRLNSASFGCVSLCYFLFLFLCRKTWNRLDYLLSIQYFNCWYNAISSSWWRHQIETFSVLLAPLWGESTNHQWIILIKASDAEFWMFSLIFAWINCWTVDVGMFRH